MKGLGGVGHESLRFANIFFFSVKREEGARGD